MVLQLKLLQFTLHRFTVSVVKITIYSCISSPGSEPCYIQTRKFLRLGAVRTCSKTAELNIDLAWDIVKSSKNTRLPVLKV